MIGQQQNHPNYHFSMVQNPPKITFIRHAESLMNKAVHDFREKRNLPYCWETFRSIDDFNHKIIYNPELCDCGISEKGLKQCLEAKQKLQNLKFDLILVSPLQRALQTCEKLFSDKFGQTDIIVQPLLAESIKYSSDISHRVTDKIKRFPVYNFEKVINEGDFWYIKNDDEQNQKLYFEHLQLYPHLSYEQKQKKIVRYMQLKHLRESNLNMRKRTKKIKQLIKSYSEQYKNIIVISHFYTIKHMIAKNVLPTGEVLDDFYGPNCSIHEELIDNLLSQDQQNLNAN